MAPTNSIPTLAKLALQYGTIDQDQYRHLLALHALKLKENNPVELDTLLLSQKFATQYQFELLKLIQDFHIVKKRGEEFGKIAVEKGFATQLDIQRALEVQKKEFKRARIKKLIGDILVESRVITTRQKNTILKEQILLDQQANHIFSSIHPAREIPVALPRAPMGKIPATHSQADEADLSDYEKQFLQMAVLDKEFAARVLEKGLASEREVAVAQNVQEEAFEKEETLKHLGDIMVAMNFITEEQKNIVLKEQDRIQEIPSTVKEADIQVFTSSDLLEARVKIDKTALPLPSLMSLKEALKAHGIVHGIYPDALLQGLLNMNLLKFTAAGTRLFHTLSSAGNWVCHLETNLSSQGEKRKGDLLAQMTPGQQPLVQKNVFGREIPVAGENAFALGCGSGTRPSHDGSGILAAKTGVPSLSLEGKLFIHPIIHVLEDADSKYGPLEAYANLNISGVLTGAYPITAGTIKAREIRGATIDAMGPIHTEVGITDSVIRSQGDIHARYLHNCRIETFGNIYIENEIFDSTLLAGGKIDSPGCRVISSRLFAKKGIKLAGTGSEKTKPCTITAGSEHHILELLSSVYKEIDAINRNLVELKEQRDEQEGLSQKTFQKMVELKIYHDRAKNKKQILEKELKSNPDPLQKDKLENISILISNFETRMEKSIASLKELNLIKKNHDKQKNIFKEKIHSLKPKIQRQTQALENKINIFLEWTRHQENISKIEISNKAFQGTLFNGIFSSLKIETDQKNFSLQEVSDENGTFKMELLPGR